MKLLRLRVERFQCIESADIALGDGLNVLYGPNDLGKSSLASAVRAALLLQHNSSAHQRFVSWYGGGAPKVSLELRDHDGRYWKVEKTFADHAGRSVLSASKDGRNFVEDCTGRRVDEKLRGMLGWGIPANSRGVPESFLAHVLLAEQDDVRKVLSGGALDDDGDESGRKRLTAALGALAQDPLFKRILDASQREVDAVFTQTGRKRKQSRLAEVSTQIKDLQRQVEELESKVGKTEEVEREIQDLTTARVDAAELLGRAQAEQAAAENQRALGQHRDQLAEQLERHVAVLATADDRVREVARKQTTLDEFREAREAGSAELTALDQALTHEDHRLDDARRQHQQRVDDEAHARAVVALDTREKEMQTALHEAQREVERAGQALRDAEQLAQALTAASQVAATQTRAAGVADRARAEAEHALTEATHHHHRAEDQLRDATRGDHVQQRELARRDLERRRVEIAAQIEQAERGLEHAERVGAALASARAAADEHHLLHAQVEAAIRDVEAEDQALAAIAAADAVSAEIERYGTLSEARAAVEQATRAADEAERLRADARQLRAMAERLRAELSSALPSSAQLEALRALHQDMGLAEARLGGGLSITVRPRGAIAIHAIRDDQLDPSREITGEVTLSAQRAITLGIDNVVDIDVIAGEATARIAASTLRRRWERELAPVLRAAGVATFDELATRCRDAEDHARTAAQHLRDADHAEARAAQLAPTDLAARQAAATALAALLPADRHDAVRAAFGALGDHWQAQLARRRADAARQRAAHTSKRDTRATARTQLETRRDTRREDAERLGDEAARAQTALGGAWTEIAADHQATIRRLGVERAAVELEVGELTDQSDAAVAAARAAVERAAEARAGAEAHHVQLRDAAQRAIEVRIAAATKLEDARTRAVAAKLVGAWQVELQGPDALALSAQHDAVRVATQRCAQLQRESAELGQQRAAAAAEHDRAVRAALAQVQHHEHEVRQLRARQGELQRAQHATAERERQAQAEVAALRVAIAAHRSDEHTARIAAIRTELAQLAPALAGFDPLRADRTRNVTELQRLELDRIEERLAQARGALSQVGGAGERDHLRQCRLALTQLEVHERELDQSAVAWQLLLATLQESETNQTAHLGNTLAGPVADDLRALTRDRYDQLELGPHLQTLGVQVAGASHPVAELSAGTQDQIATLLRLGIARRLGSTLLLDDHLSQSDAHRVAWFNTLLRDSAAHMQIVFITCRPAELLTPADLAGTTDLHVIDLSTAIKRFTPATA